MVLSWTPPPRQGWERFPGIARGPSTDPRRVSESTGCTDLSREALGIDFGAVPRIPECGNSRQEEEEEWIEERWLGWRSGRGGSTRGKEEEEGKGDDSRRFAGRG